MAWTSPRTWANGLVVTATILNTEIRDNLLELSTHIHDGSAGEGDDELAGVDSITLDDITDPAAPGASKTIIYAEGGKLKQRAGASGTEEELEVVGHQHAVTNDGSQDTGATGSDSYLTEYTNCPSSPSTSDLTLSRTPNDSDSLVAVMSCAWFENYTAGSINNDNANADLYLYADTTQLASIINDTLYPDAASNTPHSKVQRLEAAATGFSGSTDYESRISQTDGPGSGTLRVSDPSWNLQIMEVVY